MLPAALTERLQGLISRGHSRAKPPLALLGFIGTSPNGILDSGVLPRTTGPSIWGRGRGWSCRFVLMLSVLFRAAFSIRKFPPRGFAPIDALGCRSAVGTRAEGPRGPGMDLPLPDGPTLPPLLLNIRAKNLYELKTRGLGVSSLPDFSQPGPPRAKAGGTRPPREDPIFEP